MTDITLQGADRPGNIFYVYVIFRPDGTPCYVGKGQKKRWEDHERKVTNRHLANIIAQAGGIVPRVKVRENLTEIEAFETEVALITAIGREVDGGPLVNLTDGGDGVSGLAHSLVTKLLVGAKSKNMWSDPTIRERIISSQNAGKATPEFHIRRSAASTAIWSDKDRRAKASATKLTAYMADPMLGAKISLATKAAMATEEIRARTAAAQRTRFENPEERERLAAFNVGRVVSEVTREKMSAASKGKPKSPETRARMRAAQAKRSEARRIALLLAEH